MCLDENFELVALHQCELRDANGGWVGNGAVPTARIARIPETAMAASVITELDPLWILPSDRKPVIGRENFQRLVWDAVVGRCHILVVRSAARGSRKIGKSFSVAILRAMLPTAEHSFIELRAAQVPAEAWAFAEMILTAIEGTPAHAPLPDGAQAGNTSIAWIKNDLEPAFTARLTGAAGGRTVWLILDELEHHTLPNAGSRQFLEVLYERIEGIGCLRIVLIGLEGPVPAVTLQHPAGEDLLYPLREEELQHWVERLATEVKLVLAPPEYARMRRILWKAAERRRDVDLVPELAGFASEVLEPCLRAEG
jgi:hypothetical protein